MKVAVITRHSIVNFGSLLQAIATQQIVDDLGHECEIIDYIREDEEYSQRQKTLLKQKPNWNRNWLKRCIYLFLRQPEGIVVGKKFEKEQIKYLHLSKRYSKYEQLVQDKPAADVYMTGSDQVWGPVQNGTYDSAYCLSFTAPQDKKIAYAASFGHTEMTPELKDYYHKWLKEYSHIAVREDSAVAILENMGLGAKQVLDPTLLLDATYWNRYVKPLRKGKYVLIYQIHTNNEIGKYAQKVAKMKGLPLIRISAARHQMFREGKLVWAPKIDEFLSYIKYADCLITDSFHGTAFAINFNTSFVEVLPNNKTGTRNVSILSLTGLSDRILKDSEDVELANTKVDFTVANQILKEKRAESIEILKQMIEQ